MRVFIAIEFDHAIKEYLSEKQAILREYASKANFTLKDNFHLTLNFIGEMESSGVENLKRIIDDTASGREPFKLNFERLGQFPRGGKSIVWVGIAKSTELQSIYQILKGLLFQKGFPVEERALSPHITLAREAALKTGFIELSSKIHIEPLEIHVNKLTLMESTRIEGRLAYVPVYSKEF